MTLQVAVAIVAIVSAVLGGIGAAALLVWKMSAHYASLKATSEAGHAATSTAVQTLGATLGAQIGELRSERKEHAHSIAGLTTSTSTLTHRVSATEIDVATLGERMGETIDELRPRLDRLEVRVERVESDQATLHRRVRTITATGLASGRIVPDSDPTPPAR